MACLLLPHRLNIYWRRRLTMLRFPLDGLLDEQACYDFLLHILHPDGLHCPHGHALPADQAPHRRRRPIIPDYRCRACGAVFNLFTGTLWWKTCYRCSTIVQILRGFAQGVPTQHLADEVGVNRTHLLERRHQIHTLVAAHFSPYRAVARPGHRK
jgi:transposase-like protein